MGFFTTSAIRVGTPYKKIDKATSKKMALALIVLRPTSKSSAELLAALSSQNLQDHADCFSDSMRLYQWFDIKSEYILLRFSQWLKGLRKTKKEPTGIHLSLLWAADKIGSLLIRTFFLGYGALFLMPFLVVLGIQILLSFLSALNSLCRLRQPSGGLLQSFIALYSCVTPMLLYPLIKFFKAHPVVSLLVVIGLSTLFPVLGLSPVISTAITWLSTNIIMPAVNFVIGPFLINNPLVVIGHLVTVSAAAILSLKFFGNTLRGWYDIRHKKKKNNIAYELVAGENDDLLSAVGSSLNMCPNIPDLNRMDFPRPLETDAIRQSLMKKYNNNTEIVEKYMKLIDAQKMLKGSKLQRKTNDLPSSVLKIDGQHYLFDKKLGAGFCATTKKAIHLETGRDIAIKITKPIDPVLGKQLSDIAYNEYSLLRHLNKEPALWQRNLNIVSFSSASNNTIKNFSRVAFALKKIYVTQPFEEGLTGSVYALRNFTIESAKQFIQSLMAAMNVLHEQNVFHGDIKLENIIVKEVTGQSVFIDFGLSEHIGKSRKIRPHLHQMMPHPQFGLVSRQVVGVTHQASPEWLDGSELGFDTDIYALGAMIRDFLNIANFNGEDAQELEAFKETINETIINPMMSTNRAARPSATKGVFFKNAW